MTPIPLVTEKRSPRFRWKVPCLDLRLSDRRIKNIREVATSVEFETESIYEPFTIANAAGIQAREFPIVFVYTILQKAEEKGASIHGK